MTMGIAHAEGETGAETVILDFVREVRAPFSPEAVVSQFAEHPPAIPRGESVRRQIRLGMGA